VVEVPAVCRVSSEACEAEGPGWPLIEVDEASASLSTTMTFGTDSAAVDDDEDDRAPVVTGADAAAPLVGSGVADLEVPKTAAAVDVDVSAALNVLKAGGPVARFRQAAWFSSLCGTFGAGLGGGGVRLRDSDHDFRPGVNESCDSTLLCLKCDELDDEGLCDDGVNDKLALEGREECESKVDGPGPGLGEWPASVDGRPEAIDSVPPSPPAAASAAAFFFFSSASFR